MVALFYVEMKWKNGHQVCMKMLQHSAQVLIIFVRKHKHNPVDSAVSMDIVD